MLWSVLILIQFITSAKTQSLFILLASGVALASSPFSGVDPNSLSCDPAGQEFLLLPHYTDCNKFFSCAHGVEKEFTCSTGTIFDFELQGCNWEYATTCILRNDEGSGQGPEGSGDLEGSGDEVEGSGEEEFDTAFPEEIPAFILEPPIGSISLKSADLPVFEAVLNCKRPDIASKQMAYQGDCQRYWRCESGVPRSFYCTDGLYFNSETQQCDFEANVKCGVAQEDELNSEFIVYKK